MSISDKQLDKILDSHDQAMQALMTADKKQVVELKNRFADLDDLLGRMTKKRGQDGDIVAEALAEIAKKDSERAARLSKIVGSSKKKDEVEKFNPHHVPAGTPDGGQFTDAEGVGTSGVSGTSAGAASSGGTLRFKKGKGVEDSQVDKIKSTVNNSIVATHEMPKDVNIPVNVQDRLEGRPGFQGNYVTEFSDEKAKGQVFVYADVGQAPELATVHEVGHALDHQMFGKPLDFGEAANAEYGTSHNSEMRPVLSALRNSDLGGRYERHLAGDATITVGKKAASSEYIRYASSDSEMFARGYSQWITTRSGNETLNNQIAGSLNNSRRTPLYWTDKDFAPIAAEFDALFETQGLR